MSRVARLLPNYSHQEQNMTLRIEKSLEMGSTMLRLIGRVRSEYLDELKKQMTVGGQVILDLEQVTLVDVGVVNFLLTQERQGVELRNRAPFITEWMRREQDAIVGSSEALRKVLSEVTKVAPLDSTVLILGETGTGKELIARAIHRQSKRSSRAFIRVCCAAIPPALIASELFGHEKGAFTGALQKRLGRFEAADGGTIFLDEI